jgi:dTDP-glucose 4,6-dehydratase
MKNIMVTGGAGFIGSNFIQYILEVDVNCNIINVDNLTYAGNLENLKKVNNCDRYTFKKANICDKDCMDKIIKEYNIDTIINFAAESHVDRSIVDSTEFINTNIKGTQVLLDAARKNWEISRDVYKDGVKFLQISTDEVYGSLGLAGYFTEKTPLNPHSPYSASKASADILTLSYFDTYKLPVVITRCSNNYGPYQFPEKLIPLVINNCLNLENIPVYGDGLNVRDWLFVKDHCSAIYNVILNGKIGEVYNIGGHNEKTNIYIIKTIINYLHDNVDSNITEDLITYVKDRRGHDRRYGIDPQKIEKELGWIPQTKFEDGIIYTIKWYLNNKEWLENIVDRKCTNYYNNMKKILGYKECEKND